MRALVLVLVIVIAPAIAAADRPAAWLFRATPGFGYAWDRTQVCPVEGRMFVGGWQIGNFVTPSLLVGGALGVSANALPANGCDVDDSGLRMTMGMTFGPVINWYPTTSGLHVIATAGVAAFDQESMSSGYGIGGSLAIGYDGPWFRFKSGDDSRAGVLVQITATRTTEGHATVMPALLFTTGVD